MAIEAAQGLVRGPIGNKIQDIFQQEQLFAKPLFAHAAGSLMMLKQSISDNKFGERLVEMDDSTIFNQHQETELENIKNLLLDWECSARNCWGELEARNNQGKKHNCPSGSEQGLTLRQLITAK